MANIDEIAAENVRLSQDNKALRELRDKLQGEIDSLTERLSQQEIASLMALSNYEMQLASLRQSLAAARRALMPVKPVPAPG